MVMTPEKTKPLPSGKLCPNCQAHYPAAAFYVEKYGDGQHLSAWCRSCQSEKGRGTRMKRKGRAEVAAEARALTPFLTLEILDTLWAAKMKYEGRQ